MDLLEEYIKSGRIKLNTHKYHETYTVHDPCNYVRKIPVGFGQRQPAIHVYALSTFLTKIVLLD